jgi:inhibitor of nuclear factor kappa-B kinase subunit alpha
VFTDEKIFTIEQVLNKQNDRVYAASNPHASISRTSHPASVMVFAGITSDGKVPLIFVPQGVKVISKSYLDVLKKELFPWIVQYFGSSQ